MKEARLPFYYGFKQKNANKVMGVFVNAIQNQAQSACTSIEDLRNRRDTNFDWLKGKIEGALNGTIIDFHKDFYGEKKILAIKIRQDGGKIV